MAIWVVAAPHALFRVLEGTHGLYSVVSAVKGRKCFNTAKSVEYGRHKLPLFNSNLRSKPDAVRAAGKDREAL